jgi:hypothetical protein
MAAAVLTTAIIVGTGAYLWHMSATNDLRKQIESAPADYSFFTIYGCDPYTVSATADFTVAIPERLPLAEKLRLLASTLSRVRFGNLPIEIVGIDERDGKTIATVNLLESDRNRDLRTEQKRLWQAGMKARADSLYAKMDRASWLTLFFQGSTGGGCTTRMLVRTFLHQDYDGVWIDGVDFWYEGEPISQEWDHISLSGTKYRPAARDSGQTPR